MAAMAAISRHLRLALAAVLGLGLFQAVLPRAEALQVLVAQGLHALQHVQHEAARRVQAPWANCFSLDRFWKGQFMGKPWFLKIQTCLSSQM